jgi:4-amino-4-deoxy-L-arabinose transferase-like glycosyltransferase
MPPPENRLWLRRLLGVLLALAAVRLWLGGQVGIIPDEAYYWSWSLKPDWCYWDQPGGIAWAHWLWGRLFGASVYALRGLAVSLNLIASLALYGLLTVTLSRRSAFWGVLALQLVPLFGAGGLLILHDSLLIPCLALAWWALAVALERDRPRWWLVVALALAAALYAKFSAFIPAAGFALAVLAHPVGRRHLRTPWPYVGAILAAALFSPVLWWNAQHEWVAYHAVVRLGLDPKLAGTTRLLSLLDYLGGQLGIVTPILAVVGVWAAIAVAKRWRSAPTSPRLVLAVPGLFVLFYFLLNAWQARVQANWPAPAWLALVPLGVDWLLTRADTDRRARWTLIAGTALGVVATLAAYLQVFFGLVPLKNDMTDQFYGWDDLAAHVQTLRATYGDPPLMTKRYQVAGELAYRLADRPLLYTIDYQHRGSQFTLWQDYSRLIGRDVLFIDPDSLPDRIGKHFAAVTELPPFPMRRDGRAVKWMRVYHLRDLRWDGPIRDYLEDPVRFRLETDRRRRAAQAAENR